MHEKNGLEKWVERKFNVSQFWRCFPAGMKKRWWLFRLTDLMSIYWPLFKTRVGLVVVRMDGIGDMVLFRNSLDYYGKIFGFSEKDITIIGCKSWEALAGDLFSEFKVIGINEHAYAKRILYRLYVNILVRSLAPEAVISDSYFRRALIADSLVWVMDAPNSIVSYPYINEKTRPEFTYYLSTVSKVIDTGTYPTHELVRHANFLSKIGKEDIIPKPPNLPWQVKSEAFPEFTGSYVILNSGSNERGRQWPLNNYIELAEMLIRFGYKVLFVGKGENKPAALKIAAMKRDQEVFNLINKTNLSQLLDLMRFSKLVVSNDSGPAHLSIGLGVSTIVLVGGGHFGSFVPYPETLTPKNVRFLSEPMDCYHCFWNCSKRKNDYDAFPCISKISTEKVKVICAELLQEPIFEGKNNN